MRVTSIALVLLLAACGGATPMRLRRVVLFQNGVGYFERAGQGDPNGVRLRLARHEVDDVLTTLTVLDESRPAEAAAPSADVPRELGDGPTQVLTVRVGARPVTLAYSAPTSAWRASYRLVLPEERGATGAFLQAWAVVDNTTAEDWRDVDLTLATDAPLSFAVDLRTPRTVDRPNVTGHTAPPIAFGPVRSEQSTRRSGSRDGDGIPDEHDECPDQPEDRDGFQDYDGCPEADNDSDGILDVDDRCPDIAEQYNGTEDEDGCPDMGAVMVSEAQMLVLEQVYFASGRAALQQSSRPIVEAIAATLRGNPHLARVAVEGHADPTEDAAWRLSAERAAVVRNALVEQGVAAARLRVVPRGAAHPLTSPDSPRNRRVSFQIEQTSEEPASPPRPSGVSRSRLARSAPTTLPSLGGAGARFPVAREVSIPAGESAMVTILHRPTEAEDVLLYRVDGDVPASARHPYRAARLVNASGVDLVPGPVSLFARGEVVGEGLLEALHAGENAFVPYAVDASTHVASSRSIETRPARVLGFARGRLRLEQTQILRSTYRVEAGARVPARLFVVHTRAAGYTPRALPAETEQRPDALLVPVVVEPGEDAVLRIEERAPTVRIVNLLTDLHTDVRPYLAGAPLESAVQQRLETLLDARDALLRSEEEARLLTEQLGESSARAEELRETVRALDERGGRSSATVRRRVTERLERATRHAEQLAGRLADLRAREVDARMALRDAAAALRFGADPSP